MLRSGQSVLAAWGAAIALAVALLTLPPRYLDGASARTVFFIGWFGVVLLGVPLLLTRRWLAGGGPASRSSAEWISGGLVAATIAWVIAVLWPFM